MDEIARMQEHLLLLRRAVGWSAEDFGNQIGVTRQTINNLESGRTKLSKIQYIAMRAVLDAEIARSPEDTQMLQVLLDVLIDHPEKYSPVERAKTIEEANRMAPSILAGTKTREAVSKEWLTSVGTLAGLSAGALLGVLGVSVGLRAWLGKATSGGKIKTRRR